MFFATVALVLAGMALFYSYLTWNFSYWNKLGVNGPKPQFLVGNYPSLAGQTRHIIYDLDDIYKKYKRDEDFVGIHSGGNPQLLVTSPALARRIFVSDFKHFQANESSEIFDKDCDLMFALTGQEWKKKRDELIPGLTGGRVRNAYPGITRIGRRMTDYIREQTKLQPKDGLDGKDLCYRFSIEAITDCVLGLNADCFGKRPTPILALISAIFETTTREIFFFTGLTWYFPMLKRLYKVRLIPKQTEEFFRCLLENGIDFSKAQRRQMPSQCRTDFLDYMLQLQEQNHLSSSQLTTHTLMFMLKGFGNMGSVISHCLLLLARNPMIQEKLRSEFEGHVDRRNCVLDFNALIELPYLDACIHGLCATLSANGKTIRIFPPAFYSNKICTEPIELVNKNGHSLKLRMGEIIVLPLYSLHMDEDYYSNPQEFQPERFLPENGGVRKYQESGVFFGFGEGPRVCLGISFALAISKAAIVEILRNFNIRINPKTRSDNRWNPKTIQMQLDGGIWLDFEERS